MSALEEREGFFKKKKEGIFQQKGINATQNMASFGYINIAYVGPTTVEITVQVESRVTGTWISRILQLHCSFSAVSDDTFCDTELKALNCVFMVLWESRLDDLPSGQAAASTHNIEDRSNGEVT